MERAEPGEVQLRRALLSVSEKRGIVEFARGLAEQGIEIVSTGGTARELDAAGIAARPIEDFTGFPEIMDGRVKTLHPRLYGGLLARRDDGEHLKAAAEQQMWTYRYAFPVENKQPRSTPSNRVRNQPCR